MHGQVCVYIHKYMNATIAELVMEAAMDLKSWISLSLVLVPLLLWVLHSSRRKRSTSAQPIINLPPAPPGLPIIGNLYQLGELPHASLHHLAAEYGPLMYLHFGRIPTVVASSADMAKEILKTNDLAFCTRPELNATGKLSYGFRNLAFSPYTEQWRQLRKLTMLELFSAKRVESFKQIREEEITILKKTISSISSTTGSLVNMSDMVISLFNNVICRVVIGRRTTGDGVCEKSCFHDLVRESMALTSGFFVGDFFPSIKWVGWISGLHSRLQKNFLNMDKFLGGEVDRNSAEAELGTGNGYYSNNNNNPCLIKVLNQLMKDSTLGFKITRDHVKAVLLDMFLGGTDTSTITTEWAMSEMMRRPRIMKRAIEEVRSVMGSNKKYVEETDLANLPYLKFIVKETLRLHPPAPLLLPRECREDCKVGGYNIPANTRVAINVWSIARDPKYWEDPEVFCPERFENSSVDYKGQHFQYLPFGSGRRICPGMALGIVGVELTLANLLYSFDWKLPEGMKPEDVDITEAFGLSVHKKQPLLLRATPAFNI